MILPTNIEEYIAQLSSVAEEALYLADFFATAAGRATFAPPDQETPAAGSVILADPTYADLVQPEAPTLDDVTIIPPPDLATSYPAFTGVSPGPPPTFSGSTAFAFAEDYPARWLSDKVRESIRKFWSETGFESVEVEIWDRGVERALQDLHDAEDDAIAKYSMSGWSMPNDIIDRALDAIGRKFDEFRIASNAEITAKMIDLAQQNAQKAIEQGLNGEALLVAYFNRYADRSLKAAKLAALEGFGNLRAKVAGYSAYLKANEIEMKTAEEAEMGLLSGYDAFLDAKATEMDAKLDHLTSVLSTYKSLIGAYKTLITAEGAKGATEMSWREINYKANLVGIQERLHTAIANMEADNDATANLQHSTIAKAQAHVHNVAAILSEMQVMMHEATMENTDTSGSA